MRTPEELWGVLEAADRMPYGAAQIAAVEQVLAHTEATGDRELSFAARMQATEAYQFGGEDAKSFVTFSWCVADFDRDPAPFHANWRHRLLWAFKWVAGGLRDFPEVPLERTYAVLDDMERRYREGGHSLHAVYKLRFDVARHVGDRAAVEKWYAEWLASPRDDLSDCAGCDPSARIDHLVAAGRDEEALEVAAPVLEGRLNCGRQPQRILGALMLPYLRLGRLDEAADAHRRAYRINRTRPAETDDVGDHLEFCARSGNEHRGLEILQRHVAWLDEAPSPGDRMRFVARTALLLRRLTELGHGELVVRRPSGEVAVSALADELRADALATARRFDARNGTAEQSRLMLEILDAEPYGVTVPLSPLARRRPVAAPPPPPPPPVPEVEVPAVDGSASTDELLELAAEHDSQGFAARAAAVLDVLDARSDRLTPEQAGRRAATRAYLEWEEDGDPEAAAALLDEAIEWFERAGPAAAGRLSQVRAARAIARPDVSAEDFALIEADVEAQRAHGTPHTLSVARTRLSVAHLRAGDLEQAFAVLDEAAEADAGTPWRVAALRLQRSDLLLRAGRNDEATEAAGEAREHFRRHGPPSRAARAHLAFGRAAMDAEAALAAYDEALATGLPWVSFPGRLGRARELMRLQRPVEAVDEYVEVVALHAAIGGAGGGHLRSELAQAYDAAGRLPEAAEVAEEAIVTLDGEDAQTADETRYLLAGIYRRLGDPHGALANYDLVIEHLTGRGELAGRARLRMDAGDLLFRMDRDAEAADRFAGAAEDMRAVDDLLGELRAMRSRVAALGWAGQHEAAEALVAQAAARDAALPAELADSVAARAERLFTAVEHARLLAGQERFGEAVAVLTGVPEGLAELGATEEAAQATSLLQHLREQG